MSVDRHPLPPPVPAAFPVDGEAARAVVRTVTYASLFQAPLTRERLHRTLMDVRLDPRALDDVLADPWVRARLETSGDLVFHRDIHSLIPFPPALDFDVEQFNIYNCKSWSYQPKVNDICLFPSTVMHSADANESDEERWCLAFNVFARGTFGGLHELTIK